MLRGSLRRFSTSAAGMNLVPSDKMRALTKERGEKGLWMNERNIPHISPNDVLIKVKKTSLCGTDAHIYNWDAWAQKTVPVGLTIGHEFTGEVAAFGSQVKGFTFGQPVAGEGHITCGYCRRCRAGVQHLCKNTLGIGVHVNGCFADYVALPASNTFPLPPSISYDIASIMDPLGNAVHTALSFDLVGEDVLIIGAGPIGVMATAICRHVGARHIVITDVNDFRLDMARKLGATRAVNISNGAAVDSLKQVMKDLGMKEGFDVGLEMSGNQDGVSAMLSTMNNGGKISLLGIPSQSLNVDWNAIVFKGLTLKGIYGREMFETWYKMCSLLEGGLKVSSVITHVLPAEKFEDGFAAMAGGKAGKVVLDWDK